MLRLAETDSVNAAYFELFTGTGRAIRTGHMSVLGDGVRQLAGHPRTRFEISSISTCPTPTTYADRAASDPYPQPEPRQATARAAPRLWRLASTSRCCAGLGPPKNFADSFLWGKEDDCFRRQCLRLGERSQAQQIALLDERERPAWVHHPAAPLLPRRAGRSSRLTRMTGACLDTFDRGIGPSCPGGAVMYTNCPAIRRIRVR
jgi:hypothetical protein